MTITSKWQAEIRNLLLGTGTVYGIRRVRGLGSPDLRTSDVDLAQRSGVRAQQDFYGGRVIELGFLVKTTPSEVEAALDAAKEAFRVSREDDIALDLRVESAAARRYFGRPRRIRVNEEGLQFGVAEIDVQFLATDFRAYSLAEKSETLTLGTVTGGATFPLSFPLTFGSGSSGDVNVTNAGNVETFPTLRLDGPLTTPSVENVTTGEVFTYDDTIASGAYVEVNLEDRTVLLNGTASRYAKAVGSDFWALDPGVSQLRLNAAAGTGTADVSFRDAYL